jgi:hypothetical protein
MNQKQKRVGYPLRLDPELMQRAKLRAFEIGLSVNDLISRCLKAELDETQNWPPGDIKPAPKPPSPRRKGDIKTSHSGTPKRAKPLPASPEETDITPPESPAPVSSEPTYEIDPEYAGGRGR